MSEHEQRGETFASIVKLDDGTWIVRSDRDVSEISVDDLGEIIAAVEEWTSDQ